MEQLSKASDVSHPLDLPALQIAEGIRSGRFTAETVVTESLRRAKIVNGALNAFTTLREDAALQTARDADRLVALGAETPPLLGVPFAAKDLTPTKGDITTLGSWTRGDWVPQETALCIKRLETAGAILMGKTTTPEFAHSSFTASPRWGRTRNPWNPDRTCGGSSGGASVAVATGVVPYPPGIPLLMPGENAGPADGPLLGYLKSLEAFDQRFPGFVHDTHGVEAEDGLYYVYCLKTSTVA